jgi:hypothetical protein
MNCLYLHVSERQCASHQSLTRTSLLNAVLALSLSMASLQDSQSIPESEFGKMNFSHLVTWAGGMNGGLTGNVLVSNANQVSFSTIYFQYNGICTAMQIAREWDGFTPTANDLRVSKAPEADSEVLTFCLCPMDLLSHCSYLGASCTGSLLRVPSSSASKAMDSFQTTVHPG